MRPALLIARRFLLESLREPMVLGLTLFFPLFFFAITWAAYPASPRPRTWTFVVSPEASARQPGLTGGLLEAKHLDGRAAFRAWASGEAAADVAIALAPDGGLLLAGDALSVDATGASNRVLAVLDGLSAPGGGTQLVAASLPFPTPVNDFQAYAPGMMVFAILLLVPQTAVLMGREVRRGTLRRTLLAGVSARSYLLGVTLSQALFAVGLGAIQVALLWLTGFSLGPAPPLTALVVLLVCVVLSLASIAQGLVLGGWVQTDADASNVGSAVAMVQVFLSGAFFPVPRMAWLSSGTPGTPGFLAAGPLDLLPATHAMRALGRLASSGPDATAGAQLVLVLGLSALTFAAGVEVFRRRVLREGAVTRR